MNPNGLNVNVPLGSLFSEPQQKPKPVTLAPKINIDSILDVSNVKKFYEQYMSSPVYKKRLENFGVTEKSDLRNISSANVSTTPGASSVSYSQESSSQTNSQQAGFPILKGRPNIHIDLSQNNLNDSKKRYGATEYPQATLAHEMSHVARSITPKEEDFIASLNRKPDEAAAYSEYKKSGVVDSFSTFLKAAYGGNTHDAKPNEIKADLDALRYEMWKSGIYDTSQRDMNIEDYKKMLNNKTISNSLEFKRLSQRFKPQDIIKLNNTVASINHPDAYLHTIT